MRIRTISKHTAQALAEGGLIALLVVGAMAGTAFAGKPTAGGTSSGVRVDDGVYAGHRKRSGFVDPADFGVRVGAAHERGVQCSGQMNIVHVLPLAPEQRRILFALDRRSESGGLHWGYLNNRQGKLSSVFICGLNRFF